MKKNRDAGTTIKDKVTHVKCCPWCGWRVYNIVAWHDCGRKVKYSLRCCHCGYMSKKSRFLMISRYYWNHANNPIAPVRRERW